jgi:RNA polymerase sigma factor for flagellar operon FliA
MKRRRAYQDAVAALAADGGRPDEAAVASKLGVTVDKLRSDYASAEAVRFDSIDDVYSDEGPWFMSDEPDAFDQLADADQREALIEAISELPEKEQLVVQLYYVEELNLEEIGQVLGVGAARVCQIKKSAHDRLKKGLMRRLG